MSARVLLGALLALASVATSASAVQTRYALANHCFALESVANGRFVAVAGADGYRAGAARKREAAPLFFKATSLGGYLVHDRDAQLLAVAEGGAVTRAPLPGPPAEWAVTRARGELSRCARRRPATCSQPVLTGRS